MLSADLFTLIENFLSAATTFVYSSIYSIWLLLRAPRRASLYLATRFFDEKTKQVGPMTLIFLSLFIGVLSVYYLFSIVSFLGSKKTLSDNVQDFLSVRHRDTIVALLVATLAGTGIVDAFARLFVVISLRKKKLIITQARFTEVRIRISYLLVTPCLFSTILSLILSLIYIHIVDWLAHKSFSNEVQVIVVSIIYNMLIVFGPLIVLRIFMSPILQECFGKARGLLLFLARQGLLLGLYALSIAGMVLGFVLTPKLIPDTRELSTSALEDDIVLISSSCTAMNNRFTVAAQLLNRSKSDVAIFGYNAGFATNRNTNVAQKLVSPGHENEYFTIDPGKIFNYTGVAEHVDVRSHPTQCKITWQLRDLSEQAEPAKNFGRWIDVR